MLQRVMSRFFVEVFLSCSTKNLRRGTLLCCISENFRWRKSLWITGEEYQVSPSKIFCPTVPKSFVGESFSVSLISGMEIVRDNRGGGVSRFSVAKFLSNSAKKFRRGII